MSGVDTEVDDFPRYVTLLTFQTEACCDGINIYGADNQFLGQLAGSLSGPNFYLDYSEILLVFQSDDSSSEAGFQVSTIWTVSHQKIEWNRIEDYQT